MKNVHLPLWVPKRTAGFLLLEVLIALLLLMGFSTAVMQYQGASAQAHRMAIELAEYIQHTVSSIERMRMHHANMAATVPLVEIKRCMCVPRISDGAPRRVPAHNMYIFCKQEKEDCAAEKRWVIVAGVS